MMEATEIEWAWAGVWGRWTVALDIYGPLLKTIRILSPMLSKCFYIWFTLFSRNLTGKHSKPTRRGSEISVCFCQSFGNHSWETLVNDITFRSRALGRYRYWCFDWLSWRRVMFCLTVVGFDGSPWWLLKLSLWGLKSAWEENILVFRCLVDAMKWSGEGKLLMRIRISLLSST